MNLHSDDYRAAVHAFQLEPEALTAAQIDLLTAADPQLGARARARHHAALTQAAAARHALAMGTKAAPVTTPDDVADAMLDVVVLALVEPRTQIAELQAANARLAEQLLEVEATTAARSAPDRVYRP